MREYVIEVMMMMRVGRKEIEVSWKGLMIERV